MAEKETKNQPKDLIEAVPEEISKLEKEIAKDAVVEAESAEDIEKKFLERKMALRKMDKETRDKLFESERKEQSLSSWNPKTALGKAVKSGKEKDIDKILKTEKKILEPQIVDTLLSLETDLLLIGQSKGKFGGGKRRAWRQTQRKTMEGNVVTFSALVVAGDRKGHVGLGFGKAKETLPAREKAIRNSKLNLISVVRGFESEEQDKSDPHTVPFKVHGKCGSSEITLLPAPRGTGLVAGDECKKILRLAGIKDVYSKTFGQTGTTFNIAKATIEALIKTGKMKI